MLYSARLLFVACVATALAWPLAANAQETLPVVNFVYFVPSNVAFDPKAYKAMQAAATAYVVWNRGQFNDNSPNTRFNYVLGDHTWQWYVYNRLELNRYYGYNYESHIAATPLLLALPEVIQKLGAAPVNDRNLKYVIFMHAYASEKDTNPLAFVESGSAFITYQYIQLMDTDKDVPPLVVAHEVGHLWGLEHEGDKADCMQEGPLAGKCDFSADNRKKVLALSRSFFVNQFGANRGTQTAARVCSAKMYDYCTGTSGVRSCCPPEGYCQPITTGASEVYQCVPRPAKCADQLTDTDYIGNDLLADTATSSDDCCQKCSQNTKCQAYSYFLSAQYGVPERSCYLKTLAGNRTKSIGAVAGVVLREYKTTTLGESCRASQGVQVYCEQGYCESIDYVCKPSPAKCGVQHTDQEYVGYVMAKWNVATTAECCDACSQTPGCLAYSYYRLASSLVLAGECHLKSKISVRKYVYGAISGSQVTANVCAAKMGDSCAGSNGVRSCCPYDSYCQPLYDGGYQCMKRSPKCAPPLTDRDYYGNDLMTVTATSADDCCNKCVNTAGCKVYTHVGANNGAAGTCYLKKATGTTTTSYVGAVTGAIV